MIRPNTAVGCLPTKVLVGAGLTMLMPTLAKGPGKHLQPLAMLVRYKSVCSPSLPSRKTEGKDGACEQRIRPDTI